MKNKDNKTISSILKAVPLAMGVAVVVLSILNEIETQSAIIMLGIGLACLAIGTLNDSKSEEKSCNT
ncbi:MAG: hypothetical protein FWE24_03065 [Defluviitaleaceae bacterium]|nr:hypothetical protein [Defluviitaleaceae bacterium]